VNPEIVRPGNGSGNGAPIPFYVDPAPQSDSAISAKLMVYAIFKRKWQVLGVLGVVVLSILISALVRPKIYKTVAKLMLRPSRAEVQLSAGDQREITLPVAASTEMINSEMEILRSQELMRRVITRMNDAKMPIFPADTTMSEGEQIAAMQGSITVAPAPQSNVIEIDFFSRNPEKGRTIVNAITDAYLVRHAELHGSTGAVDFFESQKQTLRDRVANAEARLAAFVDREELVLPEDQIRTVLKDATRGSDAVNLQVSKIRGLEQRILTLRQQMASTPTIVESEIEHVNPMTNSLALEVSKKEAERTSLLQNYTEEDRSVASLTAEIGALRTQMSAERGSTIQGSSRTILNPIHQDLERRLLNSQMSLDDLRARVAGMSERLDAASIESTKKAVDMRQKTIELSRLQQEVSAARDAYQLYEKKQEEARISEALDSERFLNVSVLEGATMPIEPYNKMNPLVLLAALIAGTGLGVGAAVGLEFLGRNFKFEEQVEQYLELPVFAVIPDMTEIAETQHS
jgi:succinoglycan biosynthesis transport protein ExoP